MEEKVRVIFENDGNVSMIIPALKSKRDTETWDDFYRRVFNRAMDNRITNYEHINLGKLDNIDDFYNWRPKDTKKYSIVTATTGKNILLKLLEHSKWRRVVDLGKSKEQIKIEDDFIIKYNGKDYNSKYLKDILTMNGEGRTDFFTSTFIKDAFLFKVRNFPGMMSNIPTNTQNKIFNNFIKPVVKKYMNKNILFKPFIEMDKYGWKTMTKEGILKTGSSIYKASGAYYIDEKEVGYSYYHHEDIDKHVLDFVLYTSNNNKIRKKIYNREHYWEQTFIPISHEVLNKELRISMENIYKVCEFVDIEKTKVPQTKVLNALEYKNGKIYVNEQKEKEHLELELFYQTIEEEKRIMKKEKEDEEVIKRMKEKGIL